MTWVAGVDGCHEGWFVLLLDTRSFRARHYLVKELRDVMEFPERPAVVAVDIPIGLLERATKGGRLCDQEARRILGRPRASSIFSPPVRGALRHKDHASANAANRTSSPQNIGISRQSFGLRNKLLEVEGFVTPALQCTVKEVHPELSFYELNQRQAMRYSKKKADGRGLSERRQLLSGAGFGQIISEMDRYPKGQVAEDDILDACIACWTAARVLGGEAVRIPMNPQRDCRGLRMEIWR